MIRSGALSQGLLLWLISVLALVALPVSGATVEYLHTDALGSIVAVTNSAGQVIERREYEPYGRQLKPTVLADGPGYTGHVSDAATGLDYMQQRYYDPGIGKFLSADPVRASNAGANFHRYKYAANNPYRFTDLDARTERCPESDNRFCASSIQVNGSISTGTISSAASSGSRNSSQPAPQSGQPSQAQGFAPAIPKVIEAPVVNFRWISAVFARVSLWTAVLSLSGDTRKQPTVVIGENMGRVIPYAESFGLEYYRPVPAPESMWMANNRAWINEVMNQGKRIIDIGPSSWPRERYPKYPDPSSDFYIMELDEIGKRGYPTYKVNVD